MDVLHLIENKWDTGAIFVLTSSPRGVKTHSFFDSFLSLKLAASCSNAPAMELPAAAGASGEYAVRAQAQTENWHELFAS